MTTMPLRAIDLARRGGVSTQQVRNYVDQGVLPPVERRPSGYRVFTERHERAIVAARQLAAGHGWTRTRAVMNAVHAGDLTTALTEIDASHAELDRERAEIAQVLGAFAHLAQQDVAPTIRPRRIGEVARLIGVRTSALRVWEREGLLRPERERGTGYRVYDATEVRNARVVALLRRGAYPLATIRKVLDELRTTGNPERVRQELAQRERDLHRRSRARLAGSAALDAYLQAGDQ
jgi:DNA-binding transcriptional MerR regulator